MDLYPPPLPSSVDENEPSNFARQAANACLAAPLIMIGMSIGLNGLLPNHRDASGRPMLMIFGFVCCGLLIVGFVLGLLALITARASQRGSVIARVAGGYALIGLLCAIAVPNFVRARHLALQRKQALADVRAAAEDYRKQTVAALTNGQRLPQPEQLERTFSRAADHTSGETAAILHANQNFLQHMQSQQRAYENATRALTDAKVLSTATLEQRSQLQQRRAIVQSFRNANANLKTFIQHGEANYRADLATFHISPEQQQEAVNGFMKGYSAQLPLLVTVRDADERMGQAMLAVLDLFDAQWGHWRYDAASRLVRFDDSKAVGQYNASMAEIKQAGTDQAAAQQRLATVISSSQHGL